MSEGEGLDSIVGGLQRRVTTLSQLCVILLCITSALALFVVGDHAARRGVLRRGAQFVGGGASISMGEEGDNAGIRLSDGTGAERVLLGQAETEWSGLVFFGDGTRPLAELSSSLAGPSLRMYDNGGRRRLELSVLDDVVRLLVFDADGSVVWSAP